MRVRPLPGPPVMKARRALRRCAIAARRSTLSGRASEGVLSGLAALANPSESSWPKAASARSPRRRAAS